MPLEFPGLYPLWLDRGVLEVRAGQASDPARMGVFTSRRIQGGEAPAGNGQGGPSFRVAGALGR